MLRSLLRLRPLASSSALLSSVLPAAPRVVPSTGPSLFARGMAYEEKMKKYKPTTPGFRHRKIVDRSHLWKGKPIQSLTTGKRRKGGRNHHGRICVFSKGGGHKQRYRLIDFKRAGETTCVVQRLEYDPNRSAWIALIKDEKTAELSYIIAPRGIDAGDIVCSGENVQVKPGNTLPIKNIPVGSFIHNIELYPGKGGQLIRSAGLTAQIVSNDGAGYAQIKMASQEVRLISVDCRATIGTVSNPLHHNTVHGKAGVSRWMGFRPSVRGVAMNPVDHPHGGGQGKTSGGRPSSSPWGVYTKGVRTRKNKSTDRFRVRRRKVP